MRRIFTDEYHAQRNIYYGGRRARRDSKPYGCFGFLLDIVLTIITGGFWLIWVFVREMRRR